MEGRAWCGRMIWRFGSALRYRKAAQQLHLSEPRSQVQQGFVGRGAAAAVRALRRIPDHLEPFPDFVLHVLAHGNLGKHVPVNMAGIGGKPAENETLRAAVRREIRCGKNLLPFRFCPDRVEFPFRGGRVIPEEPENGGACDKSRKNAQSSKKPEGFLS